MGSLKSGLVWLGLDFCLAWAWLEREWARTNVPHKYAPTDSHSHASLSRLMTPCCSGRTVAWLLGLACLGLSAGWWGEEPPSPQTHLLIKDLHKLSTASIGKRARDCGSSKDRIRNRM